MDYTQILSRLFIGSHPGAIDDIEQLWRESAITNQSCPQMRVGRAT